MGKSNGIIRLCHALSIFVLWELHDVPHTFFFRHLYTKKKRLRRDNHDNALGRRVCCFQTMPYTVYTMKNLPTRERERERDRYRLYTDTWWKNKTSYGLGLKWWNLDRAKLWEISISRQSVINSETLEVSILSTRRCRSWEAKSGQRGGRESNWSWQTASESYYDILLKFGLILN